MKCHYEVLNISKEADDDDIKKSYRKLALKYHPDKNPGNIEECTRQFHLIQQAYDVLIDPQERAWYDKHREAILRGGLGSGDYEDNSLDVYQYFNAACYSGYSDDKEGFYGVYLEVFKNLAKEDLEFMEEGDSDEEYPEFGNSQSSYEEVVGPFYAFWESYCTAKSYVWVEKYDTREAPNRQIRRLMEQDNKKIRDKAKKERNEEVRALVGFVRKRDKRVQAYKKVLEERAADIAKRAEERKQKDREKRLKDMESYEETGWSAMSGLENDLAHLEAKYAEQFGEVSDSVSGDEENEQAEEEDYFDDLFCVACNKEFKSDRALANHEKSKKHKENVAFLKTQMLAEEDEMTKDTAAASQGDDVESSILETGDTADDKQEDLEDDDELLVDDLPKTKLSKKQKKKRKKQKLLNLGKESDEDVLSKDTEDDVLSKDTEEDVLSKDTTDDLLTKDLKDLNLNDRMNDEKNGNADDAMPSQTGSSSENRVPSANLDSEPTLSAESELIPDQQKEDISTKDHPSSTDTSKVKTTKHSKVPAKEDKGPSIPQICNKCGRSFKTRNKLFQHVKETGHALRLDVPPAAAVSVAAGSNKKKKGKR